MEHDFNSLRIVALLYYSGKDLLQDDGEILALDREEAEKILEENGIIGWNFETNELVTKGN